MKQSFTPFDAFDPFARAVTGKAMPTRFAKRTRCAFFRQVAHHRILQNAVVGGAFAAVEFPRGIWYNLLRRNTMGLVKTRRLAAMHKQERAKAGMKLPAK